LPEVVAVVRAAAQHLAQVAQVVELLRVAALAELQTRVAVLVVTQAAAVQVLADQV
jgi:hypothetical protein